MRLYMIRHGESEYNRLGLYTGWKQANLTEKGIADAEKIRPLLEKVPFDKIYASDRIRAMQTAEHALPGREYEETSLIREICLGSLEGTRIADMTEEVHRKVLAIGYDAVGGEGRETFNNRIRSFLKTIESQGYENVAAFCHGGVLHEVLKIVLETPKPIGALCSNCTIAVFSYEDGEWSLHSWINPM